MRRSRTWIPATAAVAAVVGTTLLSLPTPVGAVAAPETAVRLVTDLTAGSPDGAVGDAGLGLPGGVSSTPIGTTQWVAFESAASDLVAGDIVASSDIFVTNGTTVTRLSVLPDGTSIEGANSFDPSICDSGRKVVFTTDTDFAEVDTNGSEDVYVIDRDADADTVLDEFNEVGGVTLDIVSASYDTEAGEYIVGFNGASQGAISADCSTAVFSTDFEFSVDDVNFLPDVYARDLTNLQTPVEWISAPAAEGGEGGGYLPTVDADGSRVAFTTEGTDLVVDGGTLGGVVLRDRTVDTTEYVTVKPNGSPSTGLADTETRASISADGACVAFKANQGFDLLAGDTGPADGVFVWDDSGASPVVELASVDETGAAAVQASAPVISDDCRFVGFHSDDEFIVSTDDNTSTDVFVYDRTTDTVALLSVGATDASASGDSKIDEILWDETSGAGQVLMTSSAPAILTANGGNVEVDLFRVEFISAEVPDKPAAPTGVAGNGQVVVSWTAPNDGGVPITGYTVTASPGGATCTWTTGPLSCTVTGLTNGTGYTFTVRATNEQGNSPVSDPSASVAPRTTASAARSVVATPGNRSVALTWAAPTSTGGAAITAYRVQRSTNGTTWTTLTSSAPLTRTYTATGLTNGTAYRFRVAAVNAAGVGIDSTVVVSTPRTVATAPRSLTGKAGNKSATLTWAAPTSTGGAAITAYRVQRSTNGRTWTTVTSKAPLTRTFKVAGLKNGTNYSFRVAAINASGVGPNSAIVKVRPKA